MQIWRSVVDLRIAQIKKQYVSQHIKKTYLFVEKSPSFLSHLFKLSQLCKISCQEGHFHFFPFESPI